MFILEIKKSIIIQYIENNAEQNTKHITLHSGKYIKGKQKVTQTTTNEL